MYVCCIGTFSFQSFTTNAIYRLAQVKWFTTVIRFESHTAAVAFGFETNSIFVFHSSKSQLAFSLACYSSQGSHAALWQRMSRKTRGGRAYRLWLWLCVTPGLRLPTQSPCGWQVTDTTQGLTPDYAKEARGVCRDWCSGLKTLVIQFFDYQLIDLLLIATGHLTTCVVYSFTFRAFSRRFYPTRHTISTFVIRSETIYCCQYSKDAHRTQCKY